MTPSGKQIVIDGGPNLDLLEHLDRALPFFDRTIDLVIITHPDADHITALPAVLNRYSVDRILMTGVEHSSGRYDALRSAIDRQMIPVLHPDPARDIVMGDGVVLDIISPVYGYAGSSNNRSIVLRLLYKEHSILLTGDIEQEAEAMILASGADVQSQIIKVPHHGSRTSSSTGFLLAVRPDIGLISAGRDNRFGHPHGEIVERYRKLEIETQTTANGSISYVFD